MEEHPEPQGATTALGSTVSKLARLYSYKLSARNVAADNKLVNFAVPSLISVRTEHLHLVVYSEIFRDLVPYP